MWPPGSADTVCPRPSVTLTSNRLTLKLVCESHQVRNLYSKFGHARPLRSRIIRYVRDGRTDRQTDGRTKAMHVAPSPGSGYNKIEIKMPQKDRPLSPIELLQFGDEDGKFAERQVIARNSTGHLAGTVDHLAHYTHNHNTRL